LFQDLAEGRHDLLRPLYGGQEGGGGG
jgi:hypothetical protein